ncbi:PDC sensor domain-containing protein [Campylobacter geochelonis]|uniref:General glycosylation pathway protein n=1 Tax=Campylobacter geochelonis TaxID=1780362 RepID=A0A128EDG6_9BACT|nr:PDC sensor domain-containing protein [Campylobacter geochelonis]QKF71844.1 general glycosylation pathway protein [Campylobacter geochelonis]CZE47000.1 general glycosylation pathway protein [Campylobacter geochelonis]CZE47415.1 general glycosylation pathway protein [Campylobacter geochelonis]CZE50950.1 general glycosylation pathway protein [Campylobacter geochelonis]
MFIKEIQEYSDIRHKARAYLSYLFNRNIQNYLPSISKEHVEQGLEKLAHDVIKFDAFYILDRNGVQVGNNYSNNKEYVIGDGENRSGRSYYYNAVKEKRCYLSDPYPSSLTGELCVTMSMPVYNDKKELIYIACMDISLADLLRFINPSSFDGIFGKFTRGIYTFFAVALFMISSYLFFLAMRSLYYVYTHDTDVSDIFESTILLTLALAIFDLVKTIFEEEVLGHSNSKEGGSNTMVRFIASIIIALAIESLMLVFKFAITNPQHVVYAIYLIAGVGIMMISLSIYIYINKKAKE